MPAPILPINPLPLGKLTTIAGTPANVLMNNSAMFGNADSSSDLFANSIEFRGDLTAAAGNFYIGLKTLNKSTLAGVLIVLRPGEVESIVEQNALNTIHVGDLWFDQDTTGEFMLGWARVR